MQKELWEQEYGSHEHYSSSRTEKPSRALTKFFTTYGAELKPGKALDLGCGKGRNAVFLAKLGYKVVASDIVQSALESGRAFAERNDVANEITFIHQSSADPFQYSDGEFDLIIDMLSFHLLDATERAAYVQEVKRLLKPGGRYVFYTIPFDSPFSQKLLETSPGPEAHSYVIPETGMIEKAFTQKELEDIFSPLVLMDIETISFEDEVWGTVSEFQFYIGHFKKEAV